MRSNKYDKQLLIIGLAISLSLAGLILSMRLNLRRLQQAEDNRPVIQQNMFLKSPNFKNNDIMPGKFTCDGLDINPELVMAGTPQETVSLALIAFDPDASGDGWTHWLIWNMPTQTEKILPDTIPENAVVGKNDFGKNAYGGPCPPSGTHHYIFTLYALDAMLDLNADSGRIELLQAMEGHVLESVELVGLYSR